MARTADQVLAEALTLQPPGWIWRRMRQPDSSYAGFLGPLAQSLSDLETSAEALLEEVDPLTCDQLLPDWEQLLGLPDPCAGPEPSVDTRKAQARARLTDQGGISIPAITAYAAALGFKITITEFRPARVEFTTVEEPCADDPWRFTWLVSQVSDMGGAIGSVSATRQAVLTCELERIEPAHTTVIFDWSAG